MAEASSLSRDGRESWAEYWNRDDFWRGSELWQVNAAFFLREVRKALEFGGDDRVLDIGCGPGHLEALLSPLVREIVAVDVAGQFEVLCRARCAGLGNVSTALLGADYTDLGALGRDFSRILCVSVVQYYRGIGEVEALIDSARKIVRPGAVMLIADLPLRRGEAGFAWDGACSVLQGIREGYSGLLLRTAVSRWGGRAHYRHFCKEHEQLSFSSDELESLIRRMGLDASLIRRSLSIYANRPSLLIRF